VITLCNLTVNNSPTGYLPSPCLLNAREFAFMLQHPLLLIDKSGSANDLFCHYDAIADRRSSPITLQQ
jgi:hypothetical protein